MRKNISWILSALLVFSLTVPGKMIHAQEQLPTPEPEGDYVEGEVLVTLASPEKTDLAEEGSTSLDEEITVENTWDFGDTYISEVSSDSYSTEELMEELNGEKNVLSVEPNYYRYKMDTNDTYYSQQWYLNGDGDYQGTSGGIHYNTLNQPSGQEETVVAIVDTGIDYTHEDLAGHMWVNPYSSSSLAGTYGYDFGDNDSDPMDEDEDGHGTHCAGVISAVSNNQTGICGISDAKLMALKIFDSAGNASDSAIIAAFNYLYQAQSLGTKIAAVNCSWGGGGATSTTMKSLIEKIGEKGALFVFAAGNDSTNHDSTSSKTSCPYDLNRNYAVIVGASDLDDKKATFSDYGKSTVDLFAPGNQIFSTVNANTFCPSAYDAKKQEELCEFFTTLDTADTEIYTPSEIGKISTSLFYWGKSYSTENYYGNTGSGSLTFSISALGKSSTLELYLDVTTLGLNKNNRYYFAYDLGIPENSSIYWEHHMATSKSSSFVTSGGKTYVRLVSVTGNFSSVSNVYLDNIAISKANLDSSVLGKYNTLSGTSMAAPVVSATTALLAAIHTGDNAIERRNRLLNCARQTTALSSYCVTGGILDLSKISTASATYAAAQNNTTATSTSQQTASAKILVKKVKLNKKKATLRYGKKLKLKATVTPKNATNKKVKWSVSNTKYAKVTQKGVVRVKKKGIGHTVKVYAKAKDKSGKKAYCKVKLKKKKK